MRTIFVSAFLILGLSDAATSQCGWVLWSKADPGVQKGRPALDQPDTWTVYDGYADIQECRRDGEAKLSGIAMLYRKELGYTVDVSGRNGLFNSKPKDEVFNLEMLCFPAGFDPRK